MARRPSKVVAFKRPFRAVPLRPKANPPLRFWEPKPPSWSQAFRQVRVWLLVILMLTLAAMAHIYDRYAHPPKIEAVTEPFTRCGYGRGANCVVDGDTFHVGERIIRVAGIDAAELAGRCDAERAQAELSTRALQDWLNRGPFEMTSDAHQPTDKYGRELMTVTRAGDDGSADALADYMTREGGAHAYAGGTRGGWC
jgi:endonuclease YncB( thermonuclease family)